jgi:hypothetical protein
LPPLPQSLSRMQAQDCPAAVQVPPAALQPPRAHAYAGVALGAAVMQLNESCDPVEAVQAPAPHTAESKHLPLMHCASAEQTHVLLLASHAPLEHAYEESAGATEVHAPASAVGVTQALATQVVPAAHGAPQPPQLAGSEVKSTQAPAHALYPVLQVTPQDVPSHVAAPFAGTGQGTHDVPHEASDALPTHCAPHACAPAAHVQALATQEVPAAHAAPQAPQLAASEVTSTQAPPQSEKPLLHWKVQALLTHAGWACAGAVVHAFPQPPHALALVAVLTHVPLQRVGAAGVHEATHW